MACQSAGRSEACVVYTAGVRHLTSILLAVALGPLLVFGAAPSAREFGRNTRKPESGPQKPQPMTYPLLRRYVDMPRQKLTPQILQANGNPNDTHGTGGTCFGDSGGPVFLHGEIVAVTSCGLTANCRYIGGYQRIDIVGEPAWLATFGVKP